MRQIMGETETRVRECLVRSVPANVSVQSVRYDTHLFEEAVLDSLSTVTMISEIEKEFKIKLKEDDVFNPSFTSLRGIAELVAERVGA
jgi:acyl carrier protein